VIIQQSWGTPLVCNDGVTIAKRIKMTDPDEDLGAQLLRQAAVGAANRVITAQRSFDATWGT
jgi:chaperonin GroEL